MSTDIFNLDNETMVNLAYQFADSIVISFTYESAVVDGAGRWKQTVYITIPMIMPTVVLMTVLSLGNVLNAGFDQIYNLYSPIVYTSGDIIDTYVYRLGIEQAQYSVGTAVGMFKSVVSAFMISLSYYLADRLVGYRVL